MTASATDLGLSTERTALAWQRTALSLAVAAAIVARLTLGAAGPAAALVPALALALGLWVLGASVRRRRHVRGAIEGSPPRGGRAQIALTLATLLICATEVGVLIYQ